MFRRLVLLIILLASVSTMWGAPKQLTLNEAIELAVKQNKKIASAKLALQKSDAQVTEAFSGALPSLDISAQYNRNVQAPVFFIPNFQDPSAGVQAIRVALNNTYSVSATVSQILFNSAVFTGIGTSKIYTRVTEEQLNAAVSEVVAETKKTFYGALLAKEYVKIAETSLGNANELYRNIDALFKEGLVAEYDQIRAQVLIDNLKPQVTISKTGYEIAVTALQTYLSLPMSDEIEPVGNLDGGDFTVPSEQQAFERAMAENRDVKALRSQLEVLRDIVTINRSGYYPTLAAFGTWQNQGQSDNFSGFLSASSTIVGVNFSMNLFNGLKTNAKVEQAQVDVQNLQNQISQVEDGIRLQVRSLISRLNSAKLRVDAQVSTVRQAQRGYDIAQIRYKEGTGSLLEINDAEVSLAQAKLNSVQAVHDFVSTFADYERTTGTGDEQYLKMVR